MGKTGKTETVLPPETTIDHMLNSLLSSSAGSHGQDAPVSFLLMSGSPSPYSEFVIGLEISVTIKNAYGLQYAISFGEPAPTEDI